MLLSFVFLMVLVKVGICGGLMEYMDGGRLIDVTSIWELSKGVIS